MPDTGYFNIAGLSIPLLEISASLAALAELLGEFDGRCDDFRATGRNPHLCRAGCSHCCRHGAVFAVTVVEAVCWSEAQRALPPDQVRLSAGRAADLLHAQRAVFADGAHPADRPGQRDEAAFSRRVSALNRLHPACPMLFDERCSIYGARPLLCRAYGYPVDAFAVEGGAAMVFRSLCHLYEDMRLCDYVRARDIRERMNELSLRMTGGRNWGRFTSIEATLASLQPDAGEGRSPA